ncbi:MAG: hypothetical protein FWG98_13235 [Candidatus Cloacimonetes bacterium]|nr:hypothetical protein [Candidatus Cloacimonadota bacterium]
MITKEKINRELVLVFEVTNKQDSYARCLGAISYFETNILNKDKDIKEFYTQVKKVESEGYFTLKINERRLGSNDKMEQEIKPNEYARVPISETEELRFLQDAVNYLSDEKYRIRPPLFHLRVKFIYDLNVGAYKDLDNLHFLAMFLQQVYITCFNKNKGVIVDEFEVNKLQDRLSVVLLPYTVSSGQFVGKNKNHDTSLYAIASQYLRLFTKMHNGVIFGYSPLNKIEALNFRKRVKNNDFFPLLYLGEIESNDNYGKIFQTEINDVRETIKKGFEYKISVNDSRPFNQAGNDNPHIAIADLILDETRTRILTFFASISESCECSEISDEEIHKLGRENILTYQEEIINCIENCDRITYALFGYLLYYEKENKDNVSDIINNTIKLACEIGDGIRQLVQNSLQHSQYRSCFMSFYKQRINNQLDETKYQLCVRVTDINTHKNIIQTFVDTLKIENTYDIFQFHEINENNISVKHLLSEFDLEEDKVISAWFDYRKVDSSAHIGLTILKNILMKCEGIVSILSDTKLIIDKKHIFTNYFKDNTRRDHSIIIPKYIIPGTQVYFSVPIKPLKNMIPINLVQLANNGSFCEDYTAFANYLEHKISNEVWEKMIVLDDASNSSYILDITNARSKLNAQEGWKKIWDKLFDISTTNDQKVHFCDVSKKKHFVNYLNKNKDNCEVFIKGFFAAASRYKSLEMNIQKPL